MQKGCDVEYKKWEKDEKIIIPTLVFSCNKDFPTLMPSVTTEL